MGALVNVEDLYMCHNQFTGTKLYSYICKKVVANHAVSVSDKSDCIDSGPIPKAWTHLRSVTDLYLSHNQLTGLSVARLFHVSALFCESVNLLLNLRADTSGVDGSDGTCRIVSV